MKKSPSQKRRKNQSSNFVLCSCQSTCTSLSSDCDSRDRSSESLRRARATVAEKEAIAQDSEEALKRKEEEAEERKKASHDMVAESIRRELLESASPPLILTATFSNTFSRS